RADRHRHEAEERRVAVAILAAQPARLPVGLRVEELRAADAIARFNGGAQLFYTQADRQAGGLRGEDRHGNPAFFGFVTMAIGA
ncbi:hypothetical protein QM312_36025, partial [Burkholderia cenocepacia]|uniref:hypothetical protein n=1 Tax=Burkholderia cenocepacia TaxID=95486 RepID=UPI0024B7E345